MFVNMTQSVCYYFINTTVIIQGTWREIVEKDCQARKLNRDDAMDRSRLNKLYEGWLMVRIGEN